MAITRFGDTGPEFGLAEETTGFAQAFNCTTTHERVTVENHIGETVTAGYFNKKYEGTFELVKKNGGSLPTVATSVAVVNVSEVAKVILYEMDRKPEQKGFTKYSFKFEAWASLTLS